MYNLMHEINHDEMRDQVLVLKEFLSREDISMLMDEFEKHRMIEKMMNRQHDPWYVWLMNNINVQVTAKNKTSR